MDGCKNRGISCERWVIKHDAQLSWATNQINEVRREREELRQTIEELNNRIVELTTQIYQGATQISTIERACTFQATDIRTQLHQIEEVRRHASSNTNPVSPASLISEARTDLSPYSLGLCVEKVGTPPLSLILLRPH